MLLKTDQSLKSVKRFAKEDPNFTEGSLRALIFDEPNNGLKESGAILRLGRRVLIDSELFYKWVRKQNGAAA